MCSEKVICKSVLKRYLMQATEEPWHNSICYTHSTLSPTVTAIDLFSMVLQPTEQQHDAYTTVQYEALSTCC
jgi:hypothetical protein